MHDKIFSQLTRIDPLVFPYSPPSAFEADLIPTTYNGLQASLGYCFEFMRDVKQYPNLVEKAASEVVPDVIFEDCLSKLQDASQKRSPKMSPRKGEESESVIVTPLGTGGMCASAHRNGRRFHPEI
jgi:hypothetical protein